MIGSIWPFESQRFPIVLDYTILKRDSKEITSHSPIRFKNDRIWSLEWQNQSNIGLFWRRYTPSKLMNMTSYSLKSRFFFNFAWLKRLNIMWYLHLYKSQKKQKWPSSNSMRSSIMVKILSINLKAMSNTLKVLLERWLHIVILMGEWF